MQNLSKGFNNPLKISSFLSKKSIFKTKIRSITKFIIILKRIRIRNENQIFYNKEKDNSGSQMNDDYNTAFQGIKNQFGHLTSYISDTLKNILNSVF